MTEKKKLLLVLVTALPYVPTVFSGSLPIREWQAPGNKNPLIFYLSGDGGLNNFSVALCESLNKKGYDIVALNSKSYFWDKKTPEKAASDINNYLNEKLGNRINQRIIFIGYSFGADVLPFILNRLPKANQNKVAVSFFLALSGSTDFEIHWTDIFGQNTKRSMDVITELNKLNDFKIVLINGSDESNLPLSKVTLKKYSHEILPGGHHFDGETDEITRVLLKNMD